MRKAWCLAAVVGALLFVAALPARAAVFAPGGAFRGTNEDEVFRLLFPGWNPGAWLTPEGEGLLIADARTWRDATHQERLAVVVEHWKGDMDDRGLAVTQGVFGCDVAVFGGKSGALTLLARASNAVACNDTTPLQLDVTTYRNPGTTLIGAKPTNRLRGDAAGLTLFLFDRGTLRPVLKMPGTASAPSRAGAGGVSLTQLRGKGSKNVFEERSATGKVLARWEWTGSEYQRRAVAGGRSGS